VLKQNCSSFASFGFERRLVGLANVLFCVLGFPFFFLRGEEKNKINSSKFAPTYQRAKTIRFQFSN
jgi:hypothetical protein